MSHIIPELSEKNIATYLLIPREEHLVLLCSCDQPELIMISREKETSNCPGHGSNLWSSKAKSILPDHRFPAELRWTKEEMLS